MLEESTELGQLFGPELLVELQPFGRRAQRGGIELALAYAAGLARGNQSGLGKHAEMLGHGGHRHVTGGRQLGHGGGPGREPGQDPAPRGIGQCGEGPVEVGVGQTLNH